MKVEAEYVVPVFLSLKGQAAADRKADALGAGINRDVLYECLEAALAAVIPAIQNAALERAAVWHDEQAAGEDALAKSALGHDDDYRRHRQNYREHIWSAAAIRALKEGT